MDKREELIERVRDGGRYKVVVIFGQRARDGRIYSDTPPALGVRAAAHLEEVDKVDKERYPFRWNNDDIHISVIITSRTPTAEELEEPGTIWIE
jgi:hypothetical protein